jgi:DNA-binding NtrC family response regulator
MKHAPIPHSLLTIRNSSEAHRVLVVDDDEAVLFAYRKLIEKDGMDVDISTNLEDAIRFIRVRSYLSVITDIRLAGTDNRDGFEILRVIQKERPDIKMILTTGYGDGEVEKMARAMGISYYFNKPVPPSAILGALRKFHVGAA